MDIAEFERWMMIILISGLVFFMSFIVYDLAKKSNAGKWGFLVLFGVLGLGILGFVIKGVVVEQLL